MRNRPRYAALVLAAAALVTPPAASTAQPATSDLAVGNGSDGITDFNFSVTSGPSGENPSGSGTFTVSLRGGETFSFTEMECLSVTGNAATFVGGLAANSFGDDYGKITVSDDGSTGDTFAAAAYEGSPPPCSPITDFASVEDASAATFPRPIVSGDIVVHDASPFPTSKDQCKNGGWRNYGVFENQGDCVRFIAKSGRNQPAG